MIRTEIEDENSVLIPPIMFIALSATYMPQAQYPYFTEDHHAKKNNAHRTMPLPYYMRRRLQSAEYAK